MVKKFSFFVAGLLLFGLAQSCKDDDAPKSIECQLVSISINDVPGIVNEAAGTVVFELPYGTDPSVLASAIKISAKASISIKEGDKIDVSQPFVITVVAEDGATKKSYTVTATILPNTEAKVHSFAIEGFEAKSLIDEDKKVISISLPKGTDLSKLKPIFEVSGDATVEGLISGELADHSQAVTLTVTSHDGKTAVSYTVIVDFERSAEKRITSFLFEDIDAAGQVVAIDEDAKTVTVTLPYGTSIKNLKPIVAISEYAVLSPLSGEYADFSSEKTYTVTAEDGTSQAYKVIVSVGKSSAKAITSFVFDQLSPAVVATINEETKVITATLVTCMEVTALTPVIKLSSDATVSPKSGAAVDFSGEVAYTVTAADGSTQAYKVIITKKQPEDTPVFTGVSSESVCKGEEVIFSGKNIDGSTVELYEREGGKVADSYIKSIAATNVVVTTSGLNDGTYYLLASKGGCQAVPSATVKVARCVPGIISVTPDRSLRAGDYITITGTNFLAAGNEVAFIKGSSATTVGVESESKTSIVVRIPGSLADGEYTLKVYVGDEEVVYSKKLTILDSTRPVITRLDKQNYEKMVDDVVITGVNLSTTEGAEVVAWYMEVKEEGVSAAKPVVVYPNEAGTTIVIPASEFKLAKLAAYDLWVVVGGVKTNTVQFNIAESTLPKAVVTGVSVTEVCRGGDIVILGQNFSTKGTYVLLRKQGESYGGNYLTVKSISATQLAVAVDIQYGEGAMELTVTSGGHVCDSKPAITVNACAPIVTGIAPAKASAKSVVELKGKYFKYGSPSGDMYLSVRIGDSRDLPVVVKSDTELSFKVPSDQAVGTYTVKLSQFWSTDVFGTATLTIE